MNIYIYIYTYLYIYIYIYIYIYEVGAEAATGRGDEACSSRDGFVVVCVNM